MKKKAKKVIRKPTVEPKRSKDIFVSHETLWAVRDELKHEINSVKVAIEERFAQVDSRFAQIDIRFAQVDARFDQMDSRFDQMESRVDSKLEKVLATVYRIQALVEEQNSRNRFVLDGYAQLYDSQEDLKNRVKKIEDKSF